MRSSRHSRHGDIHGSAESFDLLIGLKVKPREIVALREGSINFTGCFIFEFPKTNEVFFTSPPKELFSRPTRMDLTREKEIVKWTKTPIPNVHRHFLDQGLKKATSIGLSEEQNADYAKIAEGSNGFYAITYKDDGYSRSHAVTLYIIDRQTRRLLEFVDTNTLYEPDS